MTGTAIAIGDHLLTAGDVAAIARGSAEATLTPVARRRIADSHATLLEQAAAGTPIYGVTT